MLIGCVLTYSVLVFVECTCMCMCMCMCIYVRPRAHPTGDRNVTPKPKHKSGNLNVSPIFRMKSFAEFWSGSLEIAIMR